MIYTLEAADRNPFLTERIYAVEHPNNNRLPFENLRERFEVTALVKYTHEERRKHITNKNIASL